MIGVVPILLVAALLTLPRREYPAGAIAAMAALITAAMLAFSEAGLSMNPYRWLVAIALVVAGLGYPLGRDQSDSRNNTWELR